MKNIIFLLFIIPFFIIDISAEPTLENSNYSVEKFIDGLVFPTTIAFVDEGIIVLEKNSGEVKFIQNGLVQKSSLLDFNVDGILSGETGLLGILVDKNLVYIYVTESEKDGGNQIANRLYQYTWNGKSLINEKIIHEFPPSPRASHVGGVMTKDVQNEIYLVIGDMASSNDYLDGPTQNSNTHTLRDTGIILKVVKDGSILIPSESENPIEHYYAIGIRNSFGITIDPITGKMWNTENGPWEFDEINLVNPKFNSGWEKIMGIATESQIEKLPKFENFVYSNPEFSWQKTIAPTALVFFESDQFLENKNNLLVADCINGNLYEFLLNENRTEFIFQSIGLQDKMLNNIDSMREIIFGTGFGCISDLEFGPDGFLYIVSVTDGTIYRIIPEIKIEEKTNEIKPFVDLTFKNLTLRELSNADLRFGNLSNSDLTGANLSKANMLNVEFNKSILKNVDMSKANLKHAIFKNADLEGINLEKAQLLGTYFGYANLKDANLKDAQIKSSNFTFSNLSHVNLENADLRASDLSHINFSYANLKNADLSHSDLSYSDFSNADLRGLYYYNTNVIGIITNDETLVDGCFGQDLWNRGLSMIYRSINQNEDIFSNIIKSVIPFFCV